MKTSLDGATPGLTRSPPNVRRPLPRSSTTKEFKRPARERTLITIDDSPGASESKPIDSFELALTVMTFEVTGDPPLHTKTSATDSLSPLFTSINFPRAVMSAAPPTNHWLAAGFEQIVPPAQEPALLCQIIGVIPCASTRIGSPGTGIRSALELKNFDDVEPTRLILVSREPRET